MASRGKEIEKPVFCKKTGFSIIAPIPLRLIA
jgi:hypothetical protein